MPMILSGDTAALRDSCVVEEAETLQAFLLEQPGREVDLQGCTHLHAAVVQVLRCARPPIRAWPADDAARALLQVALAGGPTTHTTEMNDEINPVG